MTQGPTSPERSPAVATDSARSKWARGAPYLVGVGLLAIVLATSNVRGLWAALAGAKWQWYLAAQLIMVSYITVHVWRWNYLLRLQNIRFPFPRVFLIYNAGSLAGTVTPGRVGDFARLIYFSRSSHPLVSATLSIVFDRLFDVLFLALVAVLAAFYFPLPRFVRDGVLALAGVALLIGAGLCVFTWWTKGWGWLNSVLLKVMPQWLKPHWDQGISEFKQSLGRYLTWRLGWSLALTFMAWNINFFGSFLIARSLDLPVNFWEVGALIGLSTIFTLLPVSIAGLGTREVSFIFLFSQLGLSQEQALAFSLLILGMVVVHALIGWLALLVYPPAISVAELRYRRGA